MGNLSLKGMNKKKSSLSKQELSDLQQCTGFTTKQIKRLHLRFSELDCNKSGSISSTVLLKIPELSQIKLADRFIESYFREIADQQMNFRQFVEMLAHFQPTPNNTSAQLNSRQNKLRMLFNIFDLNRENIISRDEFLEVIISLIGDKVSIEQLIRFADNAISLFDHDGKGYISFEDFCKAMERSTFDQKMSCRYR